MDLTLTNLGQLVDVAAGLCDVAVAGFASDDNYFP
jgi:hypothetical protein